MPFFCTLYYDDILEKYVVDYIIKRIAPLLISSDNYSTVKNVHDFICNTADYDYDAYYANNQYIGADDYVLLGRDKCEYAIFG